MATTYEKACRDVLEILDEVMEKYHGELRKAGLTVDVLMAWNARGDAVKAHGYPALASIKINSLKERAAGRADATMVIDGLAFQAMDDARRRSLIDHELQHLTLARPRKGETGIPTDDQGRPRLRMRRHDWQLGGFEAVARRHGEHAHEVRHIRALADEHGQLLFGFAEPDPAKASKAKKAKPAESEVRFLMEAAG